MGDAEIFSKSAAVWDEHECQNMAHFELSNFLLSHQVQDLKKHKKAHTLKGRFTIF